MIKIVTDSTVCIKRAEAQTQGLTVIGVGYGSPHRTFQESYSDTNGDFESLLKQNKELTTSQPHPAAFLSCFNDLTGAGHQVLCLTLSSRLSGTYSAAYTAAQQCGANDIAIVDSQATAGGLYLLVLQAQRLIAQGNTLEHVVTALNAMRDKVSMIFSVDDMTRLRKSRRIGFVRMSVGSMLNIKPLLRCQNGGVVSDGVARGNAEIIRRLTRDLPDSTGDIVVNYVGSHRQAANIYTIIKDKYPDRAIHLQKLGPVLATHLGLEVVAVCCLLR